jgi:hypothetical protein
MARKMQSVLAFQPKLRRLGNVTIHRVRQTVATGTDEEPETITMPFEGYARWFSHPVRVRGFRTRSPGGSPT